jgi:5-methylthioadenosine/S-adenosylhomocysteine deaminase
MRTLIEGATIISMDQNDRIIENGAILIEDETISGVGSRQTFSKIHPDSRIDAKGKIVIPGLVNAHTHLFQSLLRGLGDDRALLDWLRNVIWPVAQKIGPKECYDGARLGLLENIRSGVTTVIDNHYIHTNSNNMHMVARAAFESKLRVILARGFYDTNAIEPFLEDADTVIKETRCLHRFCMNQADGLVRVWFGPMTPWTVTAKLFRECKAVADELGVGIHIHIAENKEEVDMISRQYKKTHVGFLDSLGVLSSRFHAVHGVWLTEGDISTLSRAKCHLVYNPISNMYLASGIAPIVKAKLGGVNTALGTDGPASNNNQDMFFSMKAGVLLQKVALLDPTCLTAYQILDMATRGGARALGLEKEIGSIEKGKRADVAIINPQTAHIQPLHDPVSALVYCANASDVETVIVNGNVAMRDGVVLSYSEDEVLTAARESSGRLLELRH